mgnify:FL=1
MGDTRTWKYEFLIVLDMKQNNNEQIVFDMFEEVATESIAEARNAYTYEEIDGCYQEAKEIAKATKEVLKTFIG